MLKNILLIAASLILIVFIPLDYSSAQGSVNLEDRIGLKQDKVKQIAQRDGYSIESFTVSGMKMLRTVQENTIITYSQDPILVSFLCLTDNAALSAIITIYQSLESRGFIITDRAADSITLMDETRTIGIFKTLDDNYCGYNVTMMIGRRQR